jgi:hypothetical protein
VTGLCVDATTGLPLAGVEVSAYYPDAYGEPDLDQLSATGADGRYTLRLDSGEYYLGTMGPSALYQPGWYKNMGTWAQATACQFAADESGKTYTINLAIRPKAPVYRFHNFTNGTHFFTDSAAERDHVIVTWPHIYRYEGVAYYTSPMTDLQPLFRFYNVVSGSHFYTADSGERDDVIARLSRVYSYDGPTYAVSTTPGAKSPVWRFYNLKNGSHFYTADEAEMMNVRNTLGYLYQYEGPAFWVTQ